MKLSPSELRFLRWSVAQLIVLVAVLGALALPVEAGPLALALAVATLFSMVWPRWLALLPQWLHRLAPLALLAIMVVDFSLSRSDILPPLYRMLLWLMLYRSLQLRNGREDMQQLLLALFVILATGVLSQDLLFAVQLLLFAPMAMVLLFLHNLCRSAVPVDPVQSEDNTSAGSPSQFDGVDPAGISRRVIWRKVGLRLDVRTLLVALGLYFTLTALTALLFALMPRFNIGQALPFPRLQSATSKVGFSDQIRFGDVVDIIDDSAIAMRVDLALLDPPARPYWRMVALDEYTQEGFRVSERVRRSVRQLSASVFFAGEEAEETAGVGSWTVYMEGGISPFLPVGSGFTRLRFNSRQDIEISEFANTIRLRQTPATTIGFRFEGVSFSDVIVARQGPGDRDTLLAVPDGAANERILAQAIASVGPRTEQIALRDYANRLVEYIQSGRGYSLSVTIPQGEADIPLRWLETNLPGHCELYASSFVLLARAAGIPTRIVTGFVGGDWNGFENYFMVRNRHAHAWAEIWDPAEGWIRVDPTPGAGASESVDQALATGWLTLDRTWQAYMDSLRMLWFRRVIQFDRGDQEAIVRGLRGIRSQMLAALLQMRDKIQAIITGDWRRLFGGGSDSQDPETGGNNGSQRTSPWIGWGLLVATVLTGYALLRAYRCRHTAHLIENRWRRRAGRLRLRILQKQTQENIAPYPGIADLEAIRFGAVAHWPADPAATFAAARRWLRRGANAKF